MTVPDRSGAPDPAEMLDAALARHAAGWKRLLVGFSGGPDSTLLLALVAARYPARRVRALHINHGWHDRADEWAAQCRDTARSLGVRCDIVRVDARPVEGEGPEAAARAARYRVLRDRMRAGDVLLTAHHREDQAETLLLALLRGGGVHGWAAMPPVRTFGAGIHVRPWLELSRTVLRTALDALGPAWIDDPANRDAAYDRAWLREQVLPMLRARWPGVDATLARAAGQAAAAASAVDALAAHDYVACRGRGDDTLDTRPLGRLPEARQRALLRWWIRRNGLPRPPAARLESLRHQLLEARADRNPRVAWAGGEVRRWRGEAWAMPPFAPLQSGLAVAWRDRTRPLALPHRDVSPEALAGLDIPADATVELRFRAGGERVRPAGASHSRALAEVLRRAGVPPWERDRVPLVFVNGRLAGVVGIGPVD